MFVRPHVTKLDPKSLKCIFLGYSRLQKGYRCYCPSLNKYLVSADVTFLEATPYFQSSTLACQGEDDDLLVYTITSSEPVSEPDVAKPPILQVYSKRQIPPATCPTPAPSSSDPTSSDALPIALRKGKRQCTYPVSSFVSYHHLSSSCSFIASLDSISIPKTIHEVISHPDWHNAMIEEMSALDDNGTWNLVKLPPGKQAIGCKWVFMVKVNPDGLFISMAATYSWPSHQLDIKNAFLHDDLQEEVYMEQPPGFVAQGEYGKVCHLRRSLYGLKQSPRAWFGKFSQAVEKFGMTKSLTTLFSTNNLMLT
jgi:hypothetical protein